MNDAFALLQQLLPELATYAQTADNPQVADFAAWLHRRTALPAAPAAQLPPQEPAFLNHLSPLTQLGPLVARLQHFTHLRAQQLLADLVPITSLRDFIVLAAITNQAAPTKSEIAATSLLEMSTITEISRRLVQAGLVTEVTDPQDRRTRRLQVAPAGRRLFDKATARMEQLSPDLYEALTAGEQAELRRLLSLVNAAHTSAVGRKAGE
ncbi:MarR family transcriptional regulator [Hymenobacter sp. H14-R3]|uniref:MarR family winged helix-turn-helix transcriptional regulator n=1 Tax=Hymenobacter sp. H14-R3 TaxID=3046308 RepID=UPI0024B8BEB5|nr:MarR family transcriptional regulator [Hymenobacter sp. H14-R3]MDJ0367482.1 MarR family transcriptional regulator [Hymenobacter sp. H14-R3]